MILRRIALLVGLLCGALAAQVPAFLDQYRQRLGGAIDELARVVARFDGDSAQQGLTEAGGIDRLRANGDPLVRQRGQALAEDRRRLDSLRETQAELRGAGPVGRLVAVLTHYDNTVASGAMGDFRPAVPTTADGFAFGLAGLLVGTGAVHASGRPLRRRVRDTRTA